MPMPRSPFRFTVRAANGSELPVVAWVTANEEPDAEGKVQAVVAVAVDQAAAGVNGGR